MNARSAMPEPARLAVEAFRVCRAEVRRQLRIAPRSTWMAAVVFPFLTIWALYALPGMQMPTDVHLLRGAWSVEVATEVASAPGGNPSPSPASTSAPMTTEAVDRVQDIPGLDSWIESLKQQPFYALKRTDNARVAFEEGDVDLALIFRPVFSESTPVTAPDEKSTEGKPRRPASLRMTVLRRDDFFSSLFLDHANSVARALPAGSRTLMAERRDSRAKQAHTEGRSGLLQTAPFLLIGFAWFFLTVGATEGFVVEREKRTLEPLLSAPISREGLVWGRVLASTVQASMPMLSASLAFVTIGFSPWIFSVVLLLVLLSIPVGVALFWLFRDLEQTMMAGWRTGGMFMIGFPLLILLDDLIGTYSPLYPVGRALEQAPPLQFLLGWGTAAVLATLVCIPIVRRLARSWTV